ncbi:hypothetical protein EDB86DRAFT_2831550 [Lactarius hatsudake]|nr:hypothetical protein EDB86DRAFT_2831550 [Lactarius hatsudake]
MCATCRDMFKVVLMDSHRLSRRGILSRYSSYPGGWIEQRRLSGLQPGGKKPTFSRQARAHFQCSCGGGVGGKRSHGRAEKENAEHRWGEARVVGVKVWGILAIAQQEEVVTPRVWWPLFSSTGPASNCDKRTLRIDGCVHPPRALLFAGIAKHMSEKRTSSIDVGHKALGSWQGGPADVSFGFARGHLHATEEILTDNQGRRFEQVVGENPMPWSVDPYGAKRRWGRSLKKSSSRMLAILPFRGKGIHDGGLVGTICSDPDREL